MKRLFLFILCCMQFCLIASARTCENLANLTLPHASITMAITESGGGLTPDTSPPIQDLPSFCRVVATLMPSSDSRIRIEVWMPISGWNGKLEGTGNGGYAGRIAYGELAAGLRRGYAVANTDMGTSPTSGENDDALIGHPEKWVDWGWRSTHEMTVAAKFIINAFYGKEPRFSYFIGCSTGGEQGLMEAQRFPDDYDGIIAGAPANNRTRLHMDILWNFSAALKSPVGYLPAATLPVITKAMLNACATSKAVASDNFLSDPSNCHWDPQSLMCKAVAAPDCLSAEQVVTVRNIYGGPRNPATGAFLYPGLPRGSEFEWNSLMQQPGEPRFISLFKWVFGPSWNWRTFDFNRDATTVDARLAPILNATNSDLDAFKTHGHKLIVFHGWADSLVASQESINYYESVLNAQARVAASHKQSKIEETQGFYRLYMVPGMSHCGGGPGLNTIDTLASIELWVERGIAPQKIIAKRTDKDATEMTRPVCPYPQSARYIGIGDTNDATNFTCASPMREGQP
jgi:feruloyl esterase